MVCRWALRSMHAFPLSHRTGSATLEHTQPSLLDAERYMVQIHGPEYWTRYTWSPQPHGRQPANTKHVGQDNLDQPPSSCSASWSEMQMSQLAGRCSPATERCTRLSCCAPSTPTPAGQQLHFLTGFWEVKRIGKLNVFAPTYLPNRIWNSRNLHYLASLSRMWISSLTLI